MKLEIIKFHFSSQLSYVLCRLKLEVQELGVDFKKNALFQKKIVVDGDFEIFLASSDHIIISAK